MPPTVNEALTGQPLDPTTAMILRAMAQAGSPGTAAVPRETLEQALGQPLPASGPATLNDRLSALASFAGNAIMGRGGFGAEPLSKVMEGGKPKRVFRGTAAGYDVEDPTKWKAGGLYGPGGYYTESAEVASGYAKTPLPAHALGWRGEAQFWRRIAENPNTGLTQREEAKRMADKFETLLAQYQTGAPNVRASYLDITKPFDADTDTLGVKPLLKIAKERLRAGGKNPDPGMKRLVETLETYATGRQADQRVPYDFLKNQVGGRWANDLLKRMGYDGITHVGGGRTGTSPHRVWITFDPKQEYSAFTPLEKLP